jgi:hypothetical protein
VFGQWPPELYTFQGQSGLWCRLPVSSCYEYVRKYYIIRSVLSNKCSTKLSWNIIISQSAVQEIFCLLYNSKIYFRDSKRPLADPMLSQFNPFHALARSFPKAHLNITGQSTPGSCKRSLAFRISDNILYVSHLSYACYMSVRLILLDSVASIILSAEYNYAVHKGRAV